MKDQFLSVINAVQGNLDAGTSRRTKKLTLAWVIAFERKISIESRGGIVDIIGHWDLNVGVLFCCWVHCLMDFHTIYPYFINMRFKVNISVMNFQVFFQRSNFDSPIHSRFSNWILNYCLEFMASSRLEWVVYRPKSIETLAPLSLFLYNKVWPGFLCVAKV